MNFFNLQLVALNVHGSGSKVFQSLLDGHSEICMIPGYPLMYLYPHWYDWKKQNKIESWNQIFNNLKSNHPSLFDSRIYPGSESLDKLGKNQNEWIEIDKSKFKEIFLNFLNNVPVNTKNLIIGIHYTYMIVNGHDVSKKKIIVYHIHVPSYIEKFLVKDFPNLKVITLTRDLRGYIYRSIENGYLKPDRSRLNKSDYIIYRNLRYFNTLHAFSDSLDILRSITIKNHKIIRHEDLILRFEEVIKQTSQFLKISDESILYNLTFGGKVWKSAYYKIPDGHKVNPVILSKDWKIEISYHEIFTLEGLHYDYFSKYYFDLLYYKKNSLINKIVLFFFILIPKKKEIDEYLKLIFNFPLFVKCIFEEINMKQSKDYTKNAYYSHKWYNRGLNLNKRFILNKVHQNKTNLTFYAFFSILYIVSSLIRYFYQIIIFPISIFKRINLSLKIIIRRIFKKRILPDIL